MEHYSYFTNLGFSNDLYIVLRICVGIWHYFVVASISVMVGPYAWLMHHLDRDLIRCYFVDLEKLYWGQGTIPWAHVVCGFSLWVTFIILPLRLLYKRQTVS